MAHITHPSTVRSGICNNAASAQYLTHLLVRGSCIYENCCVVLKEPLKALTSSSRTTYTLLKTSRQVKLTKGAFYSFNMFTAQICMQQASCQYRLSLRRPVTFAKTTCCAFQVRSFDKVLIDVSRVEEKREMLSLEKWKNSGDMEKRKSRPFEKRNGGVFSPEKSGSKEKTFSPRRYPSRTQIEIAPNAFPSPQT